MARAPFATWRGSPNYTPGGLAGTPRGVVFHVEQGTEQGTNAVFSEPAWQASSHFGNPKVGPPDQYVDSADKAWAEADGNSFWWSIEHEGLSGEPLNDNQIRNDAQIIAWLRAEHGDPFPLQLTDDPNGQGLGWHGMGGNAWGGHFDCPGEPIKAQRQTVIDLINQGQGGLMGQPEVDAVNAHTDAAIAALADLVRASRPVEIIFWAAVVNVPDGATFPVGTPAAFSAEGGRFRWVENAGELSDITKVTAPESGHLVVFHNDPTLPATDPRSKLVADPRAFGEPDQRAARILGLPSA